jgi:hypothetical protein
MAFYAARYLAVPTLLDVRDRASPFDLLRKVAILATNSRCMRTLIAASVLVVAVAAGGYFYYSLTTPYPALPAVQVNAVQAAAAERKVDALRNSGGAAGKTGQPPTLTETFSDSELSSLANQELQSHSLPIDKLVVHAAANGTIESQATAHWGGQTLPLFMVATIQVVGGNRLQVTIIESKLGRVSVPSSLSDQINSALTQSMNLGRTLNMDQLVITVTEGLVTVSGVAMLK